MGFGYGVKPGENEWLILTIGHISINKFWGENERTRGPLCTSILIATGSGLLLVDPSVHVPEMAALLHDQAGVSPEEIRYVYMTHSHGDHLFGLEAFPNAVWLMAEAELAHWKEKASAEDLARIAKITPAGDEPIPGFRTLHTPGHTPGITSLLFPWRGKTVAVAGDAVMTEDHFRARDGHSNSTDFDQARSSLELLAREADLIIPGHGTAFVVSWATPREKVE